MHIKYNILLLIAFLSISVKAQEVLTVSEAIELALENNYGIKIASNNNRIAENNTSVLNSGYLPTLTGNAGATYNLDNTEAEFAMAVRTDYQGIGLGKRLLEKLIHYYRGNNTPVLTGFTMFENRNMANLAKSLGFEVTFDMEEHLIKMHMAFDRKNNPTE